LPISKHHHHEDKVFFGEQGVKVKRSSPKIVHTKFFVRNLLPAKWFSKP